MEPTLRYGEDISYTSVDRGTYRPERGDIVVLDGGLGDASLKIKRVIATAGQTVACCDDAGRVTVDGAALDETYLGQNSPLDLPPDKECRSRRFEPVTVEAGRMFVLGDTRLVSVDSRCKGTVEAKIVVGTVKK